MILSEGDWLLPRLFDGRVELQKPPLYYWLVAVSAWLRGGTVDAFDVRLPAALAALACVVWLYVLGARLGRPRAGLIAALVLATSVHFTWLARVGRVDMVLTLFVAVALGGFYVGHRDAKRRWFFAGYVALGLGMLLKGPIALALPFAVAGTHLICAWRVNGFTCIHRSLATLAWGLPLALAIAAPWYVWANAQTDNRLWHVFFVYHNVERALHGTLVSHPWWFYGARVLVDLLPWIAVAPLAWWFSRRHGHAPEERFGVTWFVIMLAVLSAAQFKRADYLLPAYPGFALWLGCVGERWLAHSRRLIPALAGVVALCVAGWLTHTHLVEPRLDDAAYRRLAEEIRRRTPLPVIFFRAEVHEAAFHVGRPLDTILEWENLDVWANQAEPVYIVMPPECAAAWPQHLKTGQLEEVLRTDDPASRRPLVVMRSIVGPSNSLDSPPRTGHNQERPHRPATPVPTQQGTQHASNPISDVARRASLSAATAPGTDAAQR